MVGLINIKHSRSMLVLAFLSGFAGGLAASLTGSGAVGADDKKVEKLIRTEQIQLVDADGKMRAILFSDKKSGVGLAFLDREDKPAVVMGTDGEGKSELKFLHRSGKPAAILDTDQLNFFSSNLVPTASFGLTTDVPDLPVLKEESKRLFGKRKFVQSPHLALGGGEPYIMVGGNEPLLLIYKGEAHVRLGLDVDNEASLELVDKNGASRAVLGRDGKILWSAP